MYNFTYSKPVVPNPGYMRNLKGVRQFKIFVDNVLKWLITTHQGVHEFYFFMLGGTRAEKGWEPLL